MENTLIIDGIRKHCQKSKQNSECIITITESISIWHVIRIIYTVGINDKIPAVLSLTKCCLINNFTR